MLYEDRGLHDDMRRGLQLPWSAGKTFVGPHDELSLHGSVNLGNRWEGVLATPRLG